MELNLRSLKNSFSFIVEFYVFVCTISLSNRKNFRKVKI